ncbi:MAG: hypothetical protein M5U35_13625 [Roseovarius sp.]|nr:hypothetical protein [Roseovarius sp.]
MTGTDDPSPQDGDGRTEPARNASPPSMPGAAREAGCRGLVTRVRLAPHG